LLRNSLSAGLLGLMAAQPIGRVLLTSLWPARGVYADFSHCRRVCRRFRMQNGHTDPEAIQENFHSSTQRRPCDYPVLFWLQQLALESDLAVFDFGGGIGQTYFQYAPLLRPGAITRWTVCELPKSVELGRKLAAERGADRLHFTTSLEDCAGHQLFIAAGSLHFWEKTVSELGQRLGGFPNHVLINRSPMSRNDAEFITIGHSGRFATPLIVRSRTRLLADFSSHGLRLVDEWTVDKWRRLPLFPKLDAQYHGLYLCRNRAMNADHPATDS